MLDWQRFAAVVNDEKVVLPLRTGSPVVSLNRHATCPWPRDLLHYLRKPFRIVFKCTLRAGKLRFAFRGLDQGCQFRPGKRSISRIDYGTPQNQPLCSFRHLGIQNASSTWSFSSSLKFLHRSRFDQVLVEAESSVHSGELDLDWFLCGRRATL